MAGGARRARAGGRARTARRAGSIGPRRTIEAAAVAVAETATVVLATAVFVVPLALFIRFRAFLLLLLRLLLGICDNVAEGGIANHRAQRRDFAKGTGVEDHFPSPEGIAPSKLYLGVVLAVPPAVVYCHFRFCHGYNYLVGVVRGTDGQVEVRGRGRAIKVLSMVWYYP